jgi:hypothetical protein
VDFLMETLSSCGDERHAPTAAVTTFHLQTIDEWIATEPRSGTPIICDFWGHYAVLLYAVVAGMAGPLLVHLDSLPVALHELPTPQADAILSALQGG